MSFGPKELAGLIRGQIHARMFDLYDAKIVSTEFTKKPGTLIVTAVTRGADGTSATTTFEVRIEQTS